MKKFVIKIIDENVRESDGMPCCVGEIQIGDFKETFQMPLEYWTLDDYREQWANGLERIKVNNQSCLVAEIQDPEKAPWVNLWVLYRDNSKIYIQNHTLFGKPFAKLLKDRPFTLETCYDFIIPREPLADEKNVNEVSEWEIDLESITNS